MPAWQFYPLMLFVLLLVMLMGKFLWRDLPKEGEHTKSLARKISQEPWYVKSISVWERATVRFMNNNGWHEMEHSKDVPAQEVGTTVVRLASVDPRREPLTIPFRPSHPSVAEIKELSYHDEIEFEFQEDRLECAQVIDLCAYLTLRNRGEIY